MAKHMVKCAICNIIFDTNKEDSIKINTRRYAHKKCFEQNFTQQQKDELDYQALENYITKRLGFATTAKVAKQIKEYHQEYGLTYSGMLKTLEWFYDIKGGDAEMANYGVGIIPYVYEEARDYYLKTYTAQQLNFGKNFNDYKPKEIVIETTIPERKKEIKLLDF